MSETSSQVNIYEESTFDGYIWLDGDSLAPPCQADRDIVFEIVQLASTYLIDNTRKFYDLGCGDGRICIQATLSTGCESVGCEIEQHLIDRFQMLVQNLELQTKITIVHGDLRAIDIKPNSVIVTYLLPEAMEQIRELLFNALKNDCILICNTWGLKLIPPKTKIMCGSSKNVTILLYDKFCIT